MKYCTSCILPDSRPNLEIMDDGRCNACHSWGDKQCDIDWTSREKEFLKLTNAVKSKSQNWDCVIPVSGGKDSTWQVIKALEYGLRPLCVTWKTPARSTLGQDNLQNLIDLGVDHIDFSINPDVERKLTLETFKKLGSVAIPMHMALFAIPLRVAVNYKIPLVLWGENSGIEYGGSSDDTLGVEMTNAWLKAYGVTQGTVAQDWVSESLTQKDLSAYVWPSDQEMKDAGVTAAFLGWYFSWDPNETFKVAKAHGFQELTDKAATGYYKFADVDDAFIISMHHWIKWYKFGFTRLWDNLSLEIRSGRMTRDEAFAIIKKTGDETPREAIKLFCEWANVSEKQVLDIAQSFRNHDVWSEKDGRWEIDAFPLKDWEWV